MIKNDKGFSLVELIVVIALMAVALTVGGFALSTISLANAKNCATEIKSNLEMARMESTRTVAENAPKIVISKGSDGNIYLKAGSGSSEKIGNSSVSVQYKTSEGYKELEESEQLIFSFEKSTGAFEQCTSNEFIVSSAGREYKITCYEKTGKVKLE